MMGVSCVWGAAIYRQLLAPTTGNSLTKDAGKLILANLLVYMVFIIVAFIAMLFLVIVSGILVIASGYDPSAADPSDISGSMDALRASGAVWVLYGLIAVVSGCVGVVRAAAGAVRGDDDCARAGAGVSELAADQGGGVQAGSARGGIYWPSGGFADAGASQPCADSLVAGGAGRCDLAAGGGFRRCSQCWRVLVRAQFCCGAISAAWIGTS